MIEAQVLAECKQYGHNTMYVLRSASGVLCFRFWAMPQITSVLLFADPKTAKGWMTKANRAGWQIEASPHHVLSYPSGMKATINPADDPAGITIIMKQAFYENW